MVKSNGIKRKIPPAAATATATATATKKKSKSSSSFLSQLQTLRDVMHGGSSQYSESDLSNCLRQCGFNVQIAAERLITGQFKASPATTSSSNKSFFSDINTNTNTNTNARTPTNQSNNNNSSNKANFKSASSNIAAERKNTAAAAAAAATVTPCDEREQKKKAAAAGSKISNPYSHAKPATSTNACALNTNNANTGIAEQGMLLCQRWICAFSTSRRGSIRYNESITIHASPSPLSSSSKMAKAANIVRFKGSNVEGTLDNTLSAILAPLMRCRNGTTGTTSPFIQVLAKGLMEETLLNIGMEVPLELNVYILRPLEFFALFDGGDLNSSSSHSDFLNQNAPRGGSQQSSLAKAAFNLLQWAHYSSLPKFDSNPNANDNNNDCANNDNDEEEENIDSNEVGSGDGEEEDAPTWAQDVYATSTDNNGPNSYSIPEEADPIMLNKKGVHLKCYQRQALSWMIHREEDANAKGSDDFRKQMELLSELVATHRSSSDCGNANNAVNKTVGVQCAVGPVMVSDEIAAKSKSLDGVEDPVVHPLWQRRFLWDKSDDDNSDAVYSFYVNELLHTASKSAPNPPKECCGGVLADSMGLGKTIMLLALIAKDKERKYQASHSNSDLAKETLGAKTSRSCVVEIDSDDDDDDNDDDDDDDWKDEKESNNGIAPKTTLVVAPLSLLAQWEEEITSKSSLSCLAYYGDQAKKLTKSDMTVVDVLITTYGMVQSEYSSKKATNLSPLLSTRFRRVILDEAHYIKNPNTGASKACCEINAERRWCVTGTPISNGLQDVFGLLKFLKHEPWCVDGFWKKAIKSEKPIQSNSEAQNAAQGEDTMAVSLARVRRVLKPLLLRRTKDTLTQDGKPILILPPVETKLISVVLSNEERYFYNALLSKSQSVFDGFIKSGTASKSWFAIFSLLQRLRQSCDHLALTVKSRLDEELNGKSNNGSEIRSITRWGDEAKSEVEGDANGSGSGNDKFLRDLLNSVNKKSDSSSTDQNLVSQSYSQKVVESLTQCIQTNGTLSDECSICLEVCLSFVFVHVSQ